MAKDRDGKNAKLDMKLKTDSGMTSTSSYRLSVAQWIAITAILEETETGVAATEQINATVPA